jgi:hypothetical protein
MSFLLRQVASDRLHFESVMFLSFDLGARATSPRAAQILTKALLRRSRSTLQQKMRQQRETRKSCPTFSMPACSNALILSCVLIDQMIPFDRDAL